MVGAEAYLSEILNLRSNEECKEYLKNQNNGMQFSFNKLPEEKPEQQLNWKGCGN